MEKNLLKAEIEWHRHIFKQIFLEFFKQWNVLLECWREAKRKRPDDVYSARRAMEDLALIVLPMEDFIRSHEKELLDLCQDKIHDSKIAYTQLIATLAELEAELEREESPKRNRAKL